MDNSSKKISETADLTSFKHGELRQIIISALGLGVLVGGIMVTPSFPIILGSILKLAEEITKKKIPKEKVKRVLKNLEKKEIIFIEKKGEKVFVHLKGWNSTTLKYSLQALFDLKKKKKQWKGKWFLVIFDVPEVQRNKRDYLRRYLNDIGFYPYQQSVYLFPYECEQEIMLIKKIVESAKYISYIIAEKIEFEDKAKRYFDL